MAGLTIFARPWSVFWYSGSVIDASGKTLRFAFLAILAGVTLCASARPSSTERTDASSTEVVGCVRPEAVSSTAARACAIRTVRRGIVSRLTLEPGSAASAGFVGASFFWPALFPVPPPTV